MSFLFISEPDIVVLIVLALMVPGYRSGFGAPAGMLEGKLAGCPDKPSRINQGPFFKYNEKALKDQTSFWIKFYPRYLVRVYLNI